MLTLDEHVILHRRIPWRIPRYSPSTRHCNQHRLDLVPKEIVDTKCSIRAYFSKLFCMQVWVELLSLQFLHVHRWAPFGHRWRNRAFIKVPRCQITKTTTCGNYYCFDHEQIRAPLQQNMRFGVSPQPTLPQTIAQLFEHLATKWVTLWMPWLLRALPSGGLGREAVAAKWVTLMKTALKLSRPP